VLYSPLICLRFQDRDKPVFNLFLRAELKPGHLANDISVELVSAQRFAPQEVRIGRPIETTGHPGVIKEVRERCTLLRVGDEHTGENMLAFWGEKFTSIVLQVHRPVSSPALSHTGYSTSPRLILA